MSPDRPEEPTPDSPCERAGLLLSLRHDGAATPDQEAELDVHLAACAECRRAARVDAAVRNRLVARGALAESGGAFAARVERAFEDQRRAARAQNRFLRVCAAAAVLVAAAAGATSFAKRHPGDAAEPISLRESTRRALVPPGVR